jgi:hypothetical protein
VKLLEDGDLARELVVDEELDGVKLSHLAKLEKYLDVVPSLVLPAHPTTI